MTLTEHEFQQLKTKLRAQKAEVQKEKPLSFGERAKLSFGGPKEIEELKRRESKAGLRGVLDIGDIADITGTILPTAGATIGAVAGAATGIPTLGITAPAGAATGAGIGAAAGEAVKRGIGQLLGVRKEETPISEAIGPVVTGLTTAGATKLFGLAGKYVASRFPKLLGLFSGETEVVNSALRNPKAADLGIQQGDEALRSAVQEAGRRSIQLREGFIKGQSEAIDNVFSGMKVTKGFGIAEKKDIQNSFLSMLKANRVSVTEKGLDFSKSTIKANPGEISKINSAYEALNSWTNWSQRGVHNLKQLVGRLTRFPTEAGGTSKSPFLGRFFHVLNEKVVAGLPKARQELYREANKKFTNAIDLFDDMVDAFNSGDPFTRISQVFGKNKDSLRMLLDFYEKKTGIDIPAIQAGRELAQERSAAFGFLNPREWIDLFISPKFQAKVVTGAGKAQQFTQKVIPEKARQGARAALGELTSRSFR